MYVGRTILGYKECEVWELTPKFLYGQMRVHFDVQSQMFGGESTRNKDKPDGFIDQIPGWG